MSFRLDALTSKELFRDVLVRLVEGVELTLNYFELRSKTVEIPFHEHPVEHLVIVLEGKLDFVFEGRRRSLDEKEGLFLPARTRHSAQVIRAPVRALEIYTTKEDKYYEKTR